MGAWTSTERLTLISMLIEEFRKREETTHYAYQWHIQSVEFLAGATQEFLEANRDQYKTVIQRYNTEKPEEEAAI